MYVLVSWSKKNSDFQTTHLPFYLENANFWTEVLTGLARQCRWLEVLKFFNKAEAWGLSPTVVSPLELREDLGGEELKDFLPVAKMFL